MEGHTTTHLERGRCHDGNLVGDAASQRRHQRPPELRRADRPIRLGAEPATARSGLRRCRPYNVAKCRVSLLPSRREQRPAHLVKFIIAAVHG